MATAAIQITLKDQILDLSRQNNIGELTPFFSALLDQAIQDGYYPSEDRLVHINEQIIGKARDYREQTGRDVVVLGMSGGVDSALTAAIFKKAGYRVIGVTMPIHQEPVETERGIEACRALDIEHIHADLSSLYDETLNQLSGAFGGTAKIDQELGEILDDANPDSKKVRIRRGNIRARLRMITLYNLASLNGGFVASTDNLSELGAGFWTLHGDVGDFSPIQSLLKSWEVPFLARLNGVPESTVRAKPTDGLGIDAGDEAQLGCSYLEWDLMTLAIATGAAVYDKRNAASQKLELVIGGQRVSDERAEQVYQAVMSRMGSTWFKRRNPLNVPHPLEDRYEMIDGIDRQYFVPECFKS